GHPYCIMSARTYGGKPASWTPPGTQPVVMQNFGPSLNGWDASIGLGWIDKAEWRAGVDADRTIELESLGSWPGGLPKVLRIKGPNADEFAVEYRNNQDY